MVYESFTCFRKLYQNLRPRLRLVLADDFNWAMRLFDFSGVVSQGPRRTQDHLLGPLFGTRIRGDARAPTHPRRYIMKNEKRAV